MLRILLLQAVFIPHARRPRVGPDDESKVLEEVAHGAAEYLDRVASELRARGRNVRTLIDERPPAAAILYTADKEQADLIAMSTHGRSGSVPIGDGQYRGKRVAPHGSSILLVKTGAAGRARMTRRKPPLRPGRRRKSVRRHPAVYVVSALPQAARVLPRECAP